MSASVTVTASTGGALGATEVDDTDSSTGRRNGGTFGAGLALGTEGVAGATCDGTVAVLGDGGNFSLGSESAQLASASSSCIAKSAGGARGEFSVVVDDSVEDSTGCGVDWVPVCPIVAIFFCGGIVLCGLFTFF